MRESDSVRDGESLRSHPRVAPLGVDAPVAARGSRHATSVAGSGGVAIRSKGGATDVSADGLALGAVRMCMRLELVGPKQWLTGIQPTRQRPTLRPWAGRLISMGEVRQFQGDLRRRVWLDTLPPCRVLRRPVFTEIHARDGN
jgi:hypothetical protein